MKIEIIDRAEKVVALILKKTLECTETTFFTTDRDELQVGVISKPEGSSVTRHIHNIQPRTLTRTTEVLIITNGIVDVTFYDDDQNFIQIERLYAGDILVQLKGGHGFEMIEESEIIEVKQGPYSGEEDKTRFNTISEEHIIIK